MIEYKAEVVADSISPDGIRITSLLCSYPRFIHAEILRHRAFSHSVASSRAIPTEKLIEQVESYPFFPETFNKRVKGMSVGEPLKGHELRSACNAWDKSRVAALEAARNLVKLDTDKSRVNRLLEPFLFVTDLITATEWDNFFALRDHSDAQPELQKIAKMMRKAISSSDPFEMDYGQWHLPLLTLDELSEAMAECFNDNHWKNWKKISAGRCARVSYDRQGEIEEHSKSIERADRLIESGHLSPFEHIARPLYDIEWEDPYLISNFWGWKSMRKEIPNEDDFSKILKSKVS